MDNHRLAELIGEAEEGAYNAEMRGDQEGQSFWEAELRRLKKRPLERLERDVRMGELGLP